METSTLSLQPNGTFKIKGILNGRQVKALAQLDIEALKKISYSEMLTEPVETWIDYWFDSEHISERELRSEISCAVSSSR